MQSNKKLIEEISWQAIYLNTLSCANPLKWMGFTVKSIRLKANKPPVIWIKEEKKCYRLPHVLQSWGSNEHGKYSVFVSLAFKGCEIKWVSTKKSTKTCNVINLH